MNVRASLVNQSFPIRSRRKQKTHLIAGCVSRGSEMTLQVPAMTCHDMLGEAGKTIKRFRAGPRHVYPAPGPVTWLSRQQRLGVATVPGASPATKPFLDPSTTCLSFPSLRVTDLNPRRGREWPFA